MFQKIVVIVSVSVFLFSCKNEAKKEAEIVTAFETSVISIVNSTSTNSSLPRLYSNGNHLLLSWVSKEDSLSTLFYSEYKNEKWSTPFAINAGKDWFVNWADFPVITENNGNILTSYLQKSANGTYTYDVKLNLYSAENKTWKKDILLHQDGTKSEHGFVSAIPSGDHSFYVVWLDGRNTSENTVGDHHTSSGAAMTLRGRIVHADGTMENDTELDNRVCDCCQTSLTAVNGESVVVYRDRSATEVRDIARIGFFDGSFSETAIVAKDNWEIAGCPVNGPAIASFKNNIAVAWFTASNSNAQVQAVFSNNSGKNYGMPIRIDSGNAIGRVDVVMISDEDAIVSWVEPVGKEVLFQVRKVNSGGKLGKTITISKTSASRASGFPQMEVLNEKLYFAWTELESNKQKSIKTATIAIQNL